MYSKNYKSKNLKRKWRYYRAILVITINVVVSRQKQEWDRGLKKKNE